MAPKALKTYEEYFSELFNLAYGTKTEFMQRDWEEFVSSRYDRDAVTHKSRINDFANEKFIGQSDDTIEIFSKLDRFGEIIESEADPVKKAEAMALFQIIEPQVNDIMEAVILGKIKTFTDEVEHNCNISDKVKTVMQEKIRHSDNIISGRKHTAINANEAPYDDLQSQDKMHILGALIDSFSSKNATLKDDGTKSRETPAQKEILIAAVTNAQQILNAAMGEKSTYKPSTSAEKENLEHLKQLCKGMSKDEKITARGKLNEFVGIDAFRRMDIEPNPTELHLSLEKNPIVDITAEVFAAHQRNGQLRYAEKEWGETTVDRMLEKFYTTEDLKTLNKAGLDPCMNIYVDGQPLWKQDNRLNKGNLSTEERAELKCAIIEKALSGAKLDVCKYVPDGKGGFKAGNVIPVKTDMNMKKEPRSFFTWLKQKFGIEISMTDKIKAANEAERDYTAHGKFDIPEQSKLDAINIQARNTVAKVNKVNSENDIKFFGEAFKDEIAASAKTPKETINSQMKKAMDYTRHDGYNASFMINLDRPKTRVNMMYLYAMTKGYKLEDMIGDKNQHDVVKANLGKEFVKKFSVDSLNEFAEKNEFDAESDDTKAKYQDYAYGKKREAAELCAKMYEVLEKQNIVFPDPSDKLAFVENYPKMHQLGSISTDFSQVFSSLKKDEIAPTDPKRDAFAKDTAALQSYTYFKTMPLQSISAHTDKYMDYIASDRYTNQKFDEKDAIKTDIDAHTKAFLSYAKDKLDGKATWGDVMADGDLSVKLAAISSSCVNTPKFLSNSMAQEHSLFLRSDDHGGATSEISEEYGQIFDCGAIIDYNATEARFKDDYKESMETAASQLGKGGVIDLSKAYAVEELEAKEEINEKISFADLVETKENVTKAPENKKDVPEIKKEL